MDNMEEEKKEGDLLLPQERRDYPRVSFSIKVHYRVLEHTQADEHLTKHFDADKIFAQTDALNLSSSGLLMVVDEQIPVKSFVAVSMYIPLPGLSCKCRVLGEVMRCEYAEGKFSIGIKFLKVFWHDLNKYKFVTLTDLLNIKGEDIKLT